VSDTPETDAFIESLNDDWDYEFAAITSHAKKLERERDEARSLAQWFYTRLKQVCLDHPLEKNVGGILARLEEAILDDPWLEEAK
jgi:hypothetical protein